MVYCVYGFIGVFPISENYYRCERHPHAGDDVKHIFTVKQEEKFQDFQYILTLNRDKIENEERRKDINMDIDSHRVATFTKDKKFLGRSYQEI